MIKLTKSRAVACCVAAFALLSGGLGAANTAQALEINVQSRYSPLQFTDAAPGGAHPIGGPAMAFVMHANKILEPQGITFKFHVSGKVNSFDKKNVHKPLVSRKKMGNLYKAVAKGEANGGLNAALNIPGKSGLSFGVMMSGGAPFGLAPDELAAYLYHGGGLQLLNSFYDEAFDGKIITIPVAITSAQGPGYFPKPLPDPDTNPNLSDTAAMAQLCRTPMIVRWPNEAAAVWTEACKRAGVKTKSIKRGTRCKNPKATCDPAKNPGNPVVNEPSVLTFGGFAPGVIPQAMYANGNIDAYELNLPSDDIQFLKLAAKLQGKSNAEVDLSKIVPPYQYSGAWHQPTLYVELILNKKFWYSLPSSDRLLIEAVARSAVLDTWTTRLNMQGNAMKDLKRHGVTQLRWSDGILGKLREAAPAALEGLAKKHDAKGDTTFRRLLESMRAYQAKQSPYFDSGDINQGQNKTPTSP